MIADGFAEEVRRLLDMGYKGSLKSMQSLGYRNMVSFLAGRQSLAEAVRLIKRDSCRYAKRQMTWFAADREVGWLDPGDVDAASKQIGLFLNGVNMGGIHFINGDSPFRESMGIFLTSAGYEDRKYGTMERNGPALNGKPLQKGEDDMISRIKPLSLFRFLVIVTAGLPHDLLRTEGAAAP